MSDTMQSLDQLSQLKPSAPEAPKYVKKVDKQGRAYATGKRKDAVARVWIKPGAGKVTVNAREVEVYFARLAFGININVHAGENSGRSLRHDFVVLSLDHQKPVSSPQEFHLLSLALEAVSRPNRTALAGWITSGGDITPLQATGGWLPHNSAGEN